MDRRDFLKTTALALAGASLLPLKTVAQVAKDNPTKHDMSEKELIKFFADVSKNIEYYSDPHIKYFMYKNQMDSKPLSRLDYKYELNAAKQDQYMQIFRTPIYYDKFTSQDRLWELHGDTIKEKIKDHVVEIATAMVYGVPSRRLEGPFNVPIRTMGGTRHIVGRNPHPTNDWVMGVIGDKGKNELTRFLFVYHYPVSTRSFVEFGVPTIAKSELYTECTIIPKNIADETRMEEYDFWEGEKL